MTRNHKVEVQKQKKEKRSDYDVGNIGKIEKIGENEESERQYRDLHVLTEVIPLVAMASVLGIYTFPFFLAKDISSLESSVMNPGVGRKIHSVNENQKDMGTRHPDVWSLWDT